MGLVMLHINRYEHVDTNKIIDRFSNSKKIIDFVL